MPPENCARAIVDATGLDLDAGQPVERALADTAIVPVAAVHQALADIAAGGNVHAQAVARVLVHDAPGGAHQAAALLLGESVDIERPARVLKADIAGIRPVDTGEAAQQRRFAGAGFTDDAEHFARPEIEADILAADPRRRNSARYWQPRGSAGVQRQGPRERMRVRMAIFHGRTCCSACLAHEIDRGGIGEHRAAMAVLAPGFAVVAVRADEHPPALVVDDDFVEVAVGRAAQAAGLLPALDAERVILEIEADDAWYRAEWRRCASRARRRRAASTANCASSDCRISGSGWAP